jgi:nucleoside-diphosphate kinase
MSKKPQKERTLVIFKPDVIQRQIVGEILTRFERKGFKIIGMKMTWASEELMKEHYIDDSEYHKSIGVKAIAGAKERGEDVTDWDPVDIGKKIRDYAVQYLSCGPILVMVFEGNCVIEGVRRILGKTNPRIADIGTIRADYTPDSYVLADLQGRAIRTILHASDSVEAAEREIPIWFKEDELYDYKTAVEHILYDAGWTKEK